MKSIRRELLASLIGAVLIVGALTALAVYYAAREEVGTLLDYQMRQMALAMREDALERYGVVEAPPHGFDYAVQISSEDGLRLHYARSRVPLPVSARTGYARIDSPEGPWRVYTLQSRGVSVQIGQPLSTRDWLAAEAAWRTLLPFLLVLPLLALFVWFAVTRGLKPLQAVAEAVKARTPASLQPLQHAAVPEEVKPVVAALNDLLLRLERALEMQRAFVADAAHELRSPLTALRLQLQLAQRAPDEAERAAALHALQEGLGRATRLVEQLLTLARQEPGAVQAPREDVDLGALAAQVVARHSPLAEDRHIDLGLARRDTEVKVSGERQALGTVLSNLVDNALRYTPEGGRVDVSAVRGEDGAAILEVTDTGPGLPPAERERVFDRFYRRAAGDVPGSGLGLAIVRGIAERHGATVVLETAPGGGLVARVIFPP